MPEGESRTEPCHHAHIALLLIITDGDYGHILLSEIDTMDAVVAGLMANPQIVAISGHELEVCLN